MENFLAISSLLNVGYALFALLIVLVFLIWLDKRMGFSFKSWIENLDSASSTPAERAALAVYLGLRIIAVCLLIGMVLGCSPAQARALSDTRYDAQIEDAAKKYLRGVDWRLLKAQYYQESRLKPEAVSPVGAAGIAQFMPRTWLEVSRQLGYGTASPHDTRYAIEAGAFYMGQMRHFWRSADTEVNRHSLAMASYNAGAGNIRKAQRRWATHAYSYESLYDWHVVLHDHLPRVTGRHAKETQTYVVRIWDYYKRLVAMRGAT